MTKLFTPGDPLSAPLDSKTRRAGRKRSFSRAFSRAIDDAGVTVRAISECLGVSKAIISRARDSEADPQLAACDLEALPLCVAEPLLRRLAESHGFLLTPMGQAGRAEELLRRAVDLNKESGEAVNVLIEAMADGHLSHRERERCLTEVEELIQVATDTATTLRASRPPAPGVN